MPHHLADLNSNYVFIISTTLWFSHVPTYLECEWKEKKYYNFILVLSFSPSLLSLSSCLPTNLSPSSRTSSHVSMRTRAHMHNMWLQRVIFHYNSQITSFVYRKLLFEIHDKDLKCSYLYVLQWTLKVILGKKYHAIIPDNDTNTH